jgi:hypothetical protein
MGMEYNNSSDQITTFLHSLPQIVHDPNGVSVEVVTCENVCEKVGKLFGRLDILECGLSCRHLLAEPVKHHVYMLRSGMIHRVISQ